jgi:hypothetical protein
MIDRRGSDSHNLLDLGLDLAPVLEDGEGNVVSNTELNEIWQTLISCPDGI